jgi:hypothetical protein
MILLQMEEEGDGDGLSLASLEPAEFAEKELSCVLFFGSKKQNKLQRLCDLCERRMRAVSHDLVFCRREEAHG